MEKALGLELVKELESGVALLVYDIPYPPKGCEAKKFRPWFSWYDWATSKLRALGYPIQYSVILIAESKMTHVRKLVVLIDDKRQALNKVFGLNIPRASVNVIRFKAKPQKQDEPALGMPDPPARLVCLVPPFEGSDHPLDRPELVIGRDESCDIRMDHRSIDDRHAKITYQEGTYSVVDLGSQDGIKVNDETYRMVTLRKGDVITIGNLKFRFVAPGEEFTFVPGIEEAEKFVMIADRIVGFVEDLVEEAGPT